jgi:hypothetical protein
MDEAEAGATIVMCYKCPPVWAHQQLQDHPNPHPDVDTDANMGVGPTQDSNDHNYL